MTRDTFILLAIAYYAVSIILIVVFLLLYNKKEKKKYQTQLQTLEREKNLIISASILSELNKVETLANNDDLKKKFDDWKERFEYLKNEELGKVTDEINDIETLFLDKNYKELKKVILECELGLHNLKTKSDFLLNEIKEVTLSEERNRETITKLKTEYRQIQIIYKEEELAFNLIKTPLELQFENVDKLFAAFESLMEKNEYTEVSKVVKAVDDVIGNLKAVIGETKSIITLGKNLIPKKIEQVMFLESKLEKEGYNLEYLNITYNREEAEKKILDIFQRLNVLNIEDSLFDLKTIHDYFDSLISDFEKEKIARKIFEEFVKSIILKSSKLEKINNELLKKIDDIKYSYDLSDDDASVIFEIKDELAYVRSSYDRLIERHRSRSMAYSKLAKEMEILNVKLSKAEEKLNVALRTLGSLKEDEARAREQLDEIKTILFNAKEKSRTIKLPCVPKNYYVELSEAMQAIDIMASELDKKPISIKILNTRVDTARDLVLKVYNTINETVKTATMAEAAIVYGNRYRLTNKDVDFGLIKAENAFYKGNFKISLENAIGAINIIEPGIHKRLLEEYR